MPRLLILALLPLVAGCGLENTTALSFGIQAQTCDTSNGDSTPHWAPGKSCIAVSYEPSLSPYLAGLQAGLDAWSKVDCSRLCFEAPEAIGRGDEVVPTGWMHFQRLSSTGNQTGGSELNYRQDSGNVLHSVVSIATDVLDELPDEAQGGAWAAAVAEGLGLPSFDGGIVAEPTAEDVAVFCGFYGPGGICALLP